MADSLHICFLSQEYPPDTGWGGIGSYTYDMAHALVQAGHRVTVIARAEGGERIADDQGIEVHRIQPAPCWDRMRVLWRLNRVWPGFAWAAMRRLRTIHQRTPVQIVEAGECRADGFFVRWIPKPRPHAITRLHLAWIFVDRQNAIAPDLKKRLTYWLEKQSILRADAITAPSAAVVELTRTWLGRRNGARHSQPGRRSGFLAEWTSTETRSAVRRAAGAEKGTADAFRGVAPRTEMLPGCFGSLRWVGWHG